MRKGTKGSTRGERIVSRVWRSGKGRRVIAIGCIRGRSWRVSRRTKISEGMSGK